MRDVFENEGIAYYDGCACAYCATHRVVEAAEAYIAHHPDHGVHPPPLDNEACETYAALCAATKALEDSHA